MMADAHLAMQNPSALALGGGVTELNTAGEPAP